MGQGSTYTTENQVFVFNKVPMTLSRAEGTFCVLTWVKPEKVSMTVGVDGLGMYNRSLNNAATIDLTILANGIENDIIDAAYKLANAAPNGLQFPLLVQQGTTLYTGLGVITGPPPVSMGDGALTNTWRFASVEMIGKTGSLPATPTP